MLFNDEDTRSYEMLLIDLIEIKESIIKELKSDRASFSVSIKVDRLCNKTIDRCIKHMERVLSNEITPDLRTFMCDMFIKIVCNNDINEKLKNLKTTMQAIHFSRKYNLDVVVIDNA